MECSEVHPALGGTSGKADVSAVQGAVRHREHLSAAGRHAVRLPLRGVGGAAAARPLVHRPHAGAPLLLPGCLPKLNGIDTELLYPLDPQSPADASW